MKNNYKVNPSRSFNDLIYDLYSSLDGKEEFKCKDITFQVTEDCCLKCTYCYQLNKSHNKMSFETAKTFVDLMLNDKLDYINTTNTKGLAIHFIGGEPLMEIELIEKICEYIIVNLIQMNHPWLYTTRFDICSNGVLYFLPKVQSFFVKYHNFVNLCISIDGNKELHDSCRIDLNGNGSYDKAIAAVHHYRDTYGIMPGVKMTLSPENIHYTYNAVVNLISEGYEEIFLNCIFEEGWNWNHAHILYNELIKLADYIIDNKYNETVYVAMFNEDYFVPLGKEDNTNWCGGTSDNMLTITPDGKYSTCLRFLASSLNNEQPELTFGSVQQGFLVTEQDKKNRQILDNITRISQSTDECLNCSIAKGCSWCSGYNYQKTGSPNKRVTYSCCMHKARALANVYYWNKIYSLYNIDNQFSIELLPEEIQLIIGGTENG